MPENKIQRTCDIDPNTGMATERDMTPEELKKFYADLIIVNAQLEKQENN
jgi:hypothetical protein